MRASILLSLSLLASGTTAFAAGKPPGAPKKGGSAPIIVKQTPEAKGGHLELIGPETNLVDLLPYLDIMNPHAAHMPPTLDDAVRVIGTASSHAGLFGAKNPYARFVQTYPGHLGPVMLVQLAHANGQGLEWVTRNLGSLMGWERGSPVRQATAAEMELFTNFNPEDKQLH